MGDCDILISLSGEKSLRGEAIRRGVDTEAFRGELLTFLVGDLYVSGVKLHLEVGEASSPEMEADKFLQDELSAEFSSLNILFLLFSPLFSSLVGVVSTLFEIPGVRNDFMEGVCFFEVLGVTAGHLLGVTTSCVLTFTESLLSRSSRLAQMSSGASGSSWWRQSWCFMSSLAVTRAARGRSAWWLQSTQVTSASDGPSRATGEPGLELCQM